MNCACGRPVYNKKRGLCSRCYQKWNYRHGVAGKRRKAEIAAKIAADPTWKRKTVLRKAESAARKGQVVPRHPNLMARITRAEAKAIEWINRDAPLIKLFREGVCAAQIAKRHGMTRWAVCLRLRRWGLEPRNQVRPTKELEKARQRAEKQIQRPIKAAIRFWQEVNTSAGADACWPWTGYRWANNRKYQEYKIPRAPVAVSRALLGKNHETAYRIAYLLGKGPIPEGMTVDHICFNPLCCNPAHLQLLTRSENSARKDPRKIEAQRLAKQGEVAA